MAIGQYLLLALLLWRHQCMGDEGCLYTLRTPMLGNHDSRLTSFAIQSVRWTLKLVKMTYEHWHAEMNFAKCIAKNFDMNVPFLSPPWDRISEDRALLTTNDGAGLPHPSFQHETHSSATNKSGGNRQESLSYQHHFTLNQDITDSSSIEQALRSTSRQTSTPNEVFLVMQSWYSVVSTLSRVLLSFFKTLWNSGVFSCTRNYLKRAFWKWVDNAQLK